MPVLRMNRCVTHLRQLEETRAGIFSSSGVKSGKIPPTGTAKNIANVAKTLKQIMPVQRAVTSGRSLELAQHRRCAEKALPYKYLTKDEVEATRRYAPRWLWLYAVLEKMPETACAVEVKVPSDIPLQRFRNMIGTAIRTHKKFCTERWTVRKTLDDDAVVIAKMGTWDVYDKEKADAQKRRGKSA